MKKIIFGVFAHPDDEAFYPAGALLKARKSGSELQMVTLTSGSAGQNPDKLENLGKARLEEWHTAGALLGVTKQHHLGYTDSQLNNCDMLSAADEIEELIRERLANEKASTKVDMYCFDFNGLSGHIDHIVASRAAALAFYRIKQEDKRMRHLKLFCFGKSMMPRHNIDWLFMEKGYECSAVDETIDARDLKQEIDAIMDAHHSQRDDAKALRKQYGDQLYIAHIRVLK